MAAKAAINPQTLADNWSKGMASAGPAYTAGIQAFTGNPMALAAAPTAQQKYLTSTADAVNSGRMANALNSADPSLWKNNAVAYGPTGLSTAGQKKKSKYMAAMQKWSGVYAAASAAAANVQGTSAKVMAAINTMRTAAGKPPLS
jgi:hypothetical protein